MRWSFPESRGSANRSSGLDSPSGTRARWMRRRSAPARGRSRAPIGRPASTSYASTGRWARRAFRGRFASRCRRDPGCSSPPSRSPETGPSPRNGWRRRWVRACPAFCARACSGKRNSTRTSAPSPRSIVARDTWMRSSAPRTSGFPTTGVERRSSSPSSRALASRLARCRWRVPPSSPPPRFWPLCLSSPGIPGQRSERPRRKRASGVCTPGADIWVPGSRRMSPGGRTAQTWSSGFTRAPPPASAAS